jgi:predicted TIM-barrel fold metal-dependent hydrolase
MQNAMKSTFDATAFFGDYPFRGFAQNSLDDFKSRCEQHNISGGAVSSFQQIFWENNLEAARRDADVIANYANLQHFVVVNPSYPRQLEELEKVLSQFPVSGLRILPNYHQYHLWDECVRDLFVLAKEHQLPIQIHREIQDQRMHWMLPVAPLASAELEWLLANPPEIKVLLSGLTNADLRGLQSKILEAPAVWADLCRVRGPVFGIEKMTELVKAKRVVYGSLWPIQNMASSLLQIEDAQISVEEKTAILRSDFFNV